MYEFINNNYLLYHYLFSKKSINNTFKVLIITFLFNKKLFYKQTKKIIAINNQATYTMVVNYMVFVNYISLLKIPKICP